MKKAICLTFLFILLPIFQVAVADSHYCGMQEQFVLGTPNLFVQSMALTNCKKHKYLINDKSACECAKKNKKLIGPSSKRDYQLTKESIKKNNIKKIEDTIKKHYLSIVDDFFLIDSKYSFNNAAKECQIKKVSEISCPKGSIQDSILKSNPTFLSKLAGKAQCEIESKYGANSCSNGATRLKENMNPVSCMNEVMVDSMQLKIYEDNTHIFAKHILNGSLDEFLRINHEYANHPLFRHIIENEDLKNKFKNILSRNFQGNITKLQNENILSIFSSPEFNKSISKTISKNCAARIQAITKTLCLDEKEIVNTSLDSVKNPTKQYVKNKVILTKKEQKKQTREDFLSFQHQLSYYCTDVKKDNLFYTNYKSIISSLPLAIRKEPADKTISKYAKTLYKFEKEFCSLLKDDHGNSIPVDSLLSNSGCPSDNPICIQLQSYINYIGQFPPKKNTEGNYSFEVEVAMSVQLKTLYGMDKNTVPNFKIRPIVAFNDSPKIVNLKKDRVVSIDKSNNVRQSSDVVREPVRSGKASFNQKENTRDIDFYKRPTNAATTRAVTGVSSNLKAPKSVAPKSADQKTYRNETLQESPIVDKESTVSASRTKVEREIAAVKDDMINSLKEQVTQMSQIANQAIDINNRFIDSKNKKFSQDNEVGEQSTVNNKENEEFTDKPRASDSEIIPTYQGVKKSRYDTHASKSQDQTTRSAFINVNPKESGIKNNIIDEIEVVFDNGKKPELNLLQEADYQKIVDYLQDRKPFILTKKYNLNGEYEHFSAKIIPMPGGSFKISAVDKKISPASLAKLHKEIAQALSVTKTTVISRRH
jgi:hypothetical protein